MGEVCRQCKRIREISTTDIVKQQTKNNGKAIRVRKLKQNYFDQDLQSRLKLGKKIRVFSIGLFYQFVSLNHVDY